jgi:hypothetical protein
MRLTSTFKKAPRLLVAAAAVSTLGVGAIVLTGSPAFATPGALTATTFATSNGAANVSGTGNTATYTINFVTGSSWVDTATGSVTFTVPTGTTLATPSVTAYGLTGCTVGTPSQTALTVTVPVVGPCTINASTPVSLAVSTFTNGSQTTAYTSTVTTNSATGTAVDTGTASVTFGSNQTVATVIVPDTLTFTNSATTVTLLPVPRIVATTTPVNLGISTNAKSGFTLQACDTAGSLVGPGTNTIPQSSNGTATALPTSGTASAFGAFAVATHGSAGTGTFTLNTPWSTTTSSLFLGYNASCNAGSGSTVATESGPVTGDQLAITNGVAISDIQAAGTYTGTITYQVNPSY